MDDTNCIDHLSNRVRMQPDNRQSHHDAAVALLTACLFFQLDAVPEYRTGLFHCIGTIRCRAPAQALITRLAQIESGIQGFYKDELHLGLDLSADDICHVCRRYSLPVRFFVRNLQEKITLSLRLGATKRRLSAFPNSVQWFIDEQKLDCPFGSPNHSIPLRVNCPGCNKLVLSRGKKRKYIEI